MNGILSDDEFVQEINNLIVEAKQNEGLEADYMTLEMRMREERKYAMEEGVAKGRAEGREEKGLAIALRMLNKLIKRGKALDEESIADIADDTEISIDRVRQLAEENGLKLS